MPAHPQISKRFQLLLARIRPLDTEVSRARRQQAAIATRLRRSFAVAKIAPFGSHATSTALRHSSDLDLYAVLRLKEARWGARTVGSATIMRRIRADLDERFAQTVLRSDQQALVLRFGAGSHSVDLVPAFFERFLPSKHPVYAIPDGDGEWMAAAPTLRTAWFNRAAASAPKLRNIVMLAKWWSRCRERPIPLQSVHLESLLVSTRLATEPGTLGQVLSDLFHLLASRDGRALRDPLKVSGLIESTKTEAQRESLVTAADYAADHSAAAVEAEEAMDWQEARRQWDLVFNGTFPSQLRRGG